jgi:6-pyruvoyltetrahydropterin/6-carboxytetrahydropterin synthase
MLQVTKIFRFETAHAIYGYPGPCSNLHGHSYILHVTVSTDLPGDDFLPAPGFILDFKELKQIVRRTIVEKFDHRTILSKDYLANNPALSHVSNSWVWQVEPTAENILLYIRHALRKELPGNVFLTRLKMYETSESYAEWEEK